MHQQKQAECPGACVHGPLPKTPRCSPVPAAARCTRRPTMQLLGLAVTRREVEQMLAEVDRDGSGGRQRGRGWGVAHRGASAGAAARRLPQRAPAAAQARTCGGMRLLPPVRHPRCPVCRPLPPGEVEYAEFVEIMTLQLTRLAEQKEAAQERRTAAAAAAGPGGGGSGAAASDAAIAAALPFDVVATAYRRKKLMGALEEDDKCAGWLEGERGGGHAGRNALCRPGCSSAPECSMPLRACLRTCCASPCRDFILSVAAAEEAEKRREEAEAAAAAARRSRRGSAVPSAASSRRPSAAPQPPGAEGSAAREQAPPLGSHASFLESLSAEERHIIGAWRWLLGWRRRGVLGA